MMVGNDGGEDAEREDEASGSGRVRQVTAEHETGTDICVGEQLIYDIASALHKQLAIREAENNEGEQELKCNSPADHLPIKSFTIGGEEIGSAQDQGDSKNSGEVQSALLWPGLKPGGMLCLTRR
jgi:hypothetical protein